MSLSLIESKIDQSFKGSPENFLDVIIAELSKTKESLENEIEAKRLERKEQLEKFYAQANSITSPDSEYEEVAGKLVLVAKEYKNVVEKKEQEPEITEEGFVVVAEEAKLSVKNLRAMFEKK